MQTTKIDYEKCDYCMKCENHFRRLFSVYAGAFRISKNDEEFPEYKKKIDAAMSNCPSGAISFQEVTKTTGHNRSQTQNYKIAETPVIGALGANRTRDTRIRN